MFIRFTDREDGPPVAFDRSRCIRHARRGRVAKLSSLPDAELALLAACASQDWDQQADASIPQLIAEQLCMDPDAIAVGFDEEELTYAQLWARSGAVAARLRAAGVRRGHLVGLCCERSPELVVGMLGILRSGAAYVPLDLSYSAQQLTFMREDIGLRVIVRQAGVELPGGAYRSVIVEEDPLSLVEAEADGLLEDDPWAAGPDDLAYLSYPSAPGGAPTIMASHRNVLSLLDATRRFG